MNAFNRREIAGRIRGLLAGQDGEDLAQTARRLSVDEVSVRLSIDTDSPYPTVDVMVAIVAAYGVDVQWLLTGVYDGATHRRVLDADRETVGDVMRGLARDITSHPPVAEPTDEHQRLRLA